jgi:Fe-Mn family superoxide dismutase
MTPDELERRGFLRGAGFVAGAAAIANTLPSAARAATSASPGAIPMTYDAKPLPFDPKKLSGISEKLIVSHHDNNYAGAVKRLNAITAQLAGLDWASAPTFTINGLKREELIATNSMILHEHYFNALGGNGGDPSGALAQAIAGDFGSLARWRAEFVAMGKAQGGGSGWVVLAYSPRDKRLVNAWAADHTTTLAGGRPVLVLDMYEHAYQMDYGAKAAAYVDAFMGNIRWDEPARLYEGYRREV